MLFILVMNAFNKLINHATATGVLRTTGHRTLQHHYSLYADDVVLFITLTDWDLTAVTTILDVFDEALGLRTNLAKCTVMPMCCTEEEVQRTAAYLPCSLFEFSITYLGMSLTSGQLLKMHLEPLVDKVHNRLPTWKARLMHKAERVSLTKSTLTAILIYPLISIKLPTWAINAIDKY